MVAMKLATIAVLATVAVAAPTTAVTTTTEAKPFSFSQWVQDIMNPDVVALTPEQAVEAYYQSINATTSTHDGAAKVKRSPNQVWCTSDELDTPRHLLRPDVDAAVKCVSGLAAQGTSVRYHLRADQYLSLCRDIPLPGVVINAQRLVKINPEAWYDWGTAHDFAVAGGHIMDACTWGGTTGGKITPDFNPIKVEMWKRT